MCDVLSIASVALIATGTAATAYAYRQADKAQGAATEAELARQKKFRGEADQVLARTIQGNAGKTTQEGAAKEAAARDAAYQNVAKQTGVFTPPGIERSRGDTTDKVVADAYASEGQKASDYVSQQGNARAQMEGLSDQFLNNAIFTQNQANEIQKLGSFMQGSANVLPYELNAAGHAGDSSKGLGTILSALGGVTGQAAASGVGSGGTAKSYPTLEAAQAANPPGTIFTKTWRGYFPKAKPYTTNPASYPIT